MRFAAAWLSFRMASRNSASFCFSASVEGTHGGKKTVCVWPITSTSNVHTGSADSVRQSSLLCGGNLADATLQVVQCVPTRSRRATESSAVPLPKREQPLSLTLTHSGARLYGNQEIPNSYMCHPCMWHPRPGCRCVPAPCGGIDDRVLLSISEFLQVLFASNTPTRSSSYTSVQGVFATARVPVCRCHRRNTVHVTSRSRNTRQAIAILVLRSRVAPASGDGSKNGSHALDLVSICPYAACETETAAPEAERSVGVRQRECCAANHDRRTPKHPIKDTDG
jgi:hypothetical protein